MSSCDERFIGYGGNKAACLYELYLSGVSYYVLPEDFLVHQSHAYAEKARQHEVRHCLTSSSPLGIIADTHGQRRYNRKLYTDFREELCFRYLNRFVDSGEVNTSKARNLLVRFVLERILALTLTEPQRAGGVQEDQGLLDGC